MKGNGLVVIVFGPNEVKEALRSIQMRPESRVDHEETRFEGLQKTVERNITQEHQEQTLLLSLPRKGVALSVQL